MRVKTNHVELEALIIQHEYRKIPYFHPLIKNNLFLLSLPKCYSNLNLKNSNLFLFHYSNNYMSKLINIVLEVLP